MATDDGRTWAVVNGEIYNHRSLARDYGFASHVSEQSDVECILHLYQALGSERLFEKLDGKFALVIWDDDAGALTLARDPFGVKPLYYAVVPSGVIFGSELKALMEHPEAPRKRAIGAMGGMAAAQSYVEGVELVGGGAMHVVTKASEARRQYWSLAPEKRDHAAGQSAAACVERYADLFSDSIAKRLMTDAWPVGVCLSGGLDSAVTLAAARAAYRGELDTPLCCFTIDEDSTRAAGDVDAASRLCEKLCVPLEKVRFDWREWCEQVQFDLSAFEYYVWLLDAPAFHLEFVLKHEVHRVAKTLYPSLKVMLIGQGADEFAGGYSVVPPRVGASNWQEYIRGGRPIYTATPRWDAVKEWWRERSGRSGREYWLEYCAHVERHRLALQRYNLWHEDRSAAANGIEARVPFLDKALVEYVISVPEKFHQDLFWNKGIVRRMALRWLPVELTMRPKVPLFAVDRRESVYRLLGQMLARIYPQFCAKYGAMDNECRHRLETMVMSAFREGDRNALDGALQKMAAIVFATRVTSASGWNHGVQRRHWCSG